MNSQTRNWGGLTVALSLFLAACSGGGSGGLSGSNGNSPGSPDSGNGGGSNPFAGLSYYAGDHIATLEVEAPNASEFLLHGNVPLPQGAYPSSNGKKSFGILDYEGTLVPAQVEIVSRYANSVDGADIVELWARVHKDPILNAGARLQYKVVDLFYEPSVPDFGSADELVNSSLNLPESIKSLLQTPGSLVFHSKDVFGNEYSLDALAGTGSSSVLQKGPATVQWRHFGQLAPTTVVPGSAGTLPHLMAVHAYARVSAQDPILLLDLRVSNGSIGANPQAPEPLSKLYFESFELRLPKGYTLLEDVTDPLFGNAEEVNASTNSWPIVKPTGDGTMHLMPRQSHFTRRLAIVPTGSESLAQSRLALEGLGFVRAGMNFANGKVLFSWQNAATSRYYAQKHPLPNYDHIGQAAILNEDAADYASLESIVKTGGVSPGNYPVAFPALGAFHPYQGQYGGMTGGDEIFIYNATKTAYAASRNGVRYELLRMRMWDEREPIALFKANGDQATPMDFLKQGSGFQYVPFDFFINPNGSSGPAFFGMNLPPNFQVSAVESLGKKPSYETDLLGFAPCDLQHYIRIMGRAKVCTYLANDSLAKDDMRLLAGVNWLSHHQFYNNAYKGAQGSGLCASTIFVAANPHKGFDFGRGEAWGLDAMSVAYGIGDDSWRANTKPWFDAMVDTVALGQTCNGITQALYTDKSYFANKGDYNLYQAYEMGIVGNALVSALSSVYIGTNDAARITQVKNSISNLVKGLTTIGWMSSKHGPYSQVATGPKDFSTTFCTSVPADGLTSDIDSFQNWSNLAYAYELTGDTTYLDRAKEMGGGSTTSLKSKLQFNGYGENSGNQAALLWLCQALGWF